MELAPVDAVEAERVHECVGAQAADANSKDFFSVASNCLVRLPELATDRELVSTELAWPVAHPTAVGVRRGLHVGTFAATGKAVLRVPTTGRYTFGVECAHSAAEAVSLCALQIFDSEPGPDGSAPTLLLRDSGSVFLRAGAAYPLDVAYLHLEHGHELRVRVSVEPRAQGKSSVDEPQTLAALPAAWLSPREGAGECAGVRVVVRGIEAQHQAAATTCRFEPPSHAHTAVVSSCSLDGVQLSADLATVPKLRIGSRIECVGARLHHSAHHSHPDAEANALLRASATSGAADGAADALSGEADRGNEFGHNGGEIRVGGARVCSTEPSSNHSVLACTVRQLRGAAQGALRGAGQVRVWTSGGGWALMPRAQMQVWLDPPPPRPGTAALGLARAAVSRVQAEPGADGRRMLLQTGLRRWSEQSAFAALSGACATGGDCVIPAGERWLLDADMSVRTLTILGELLWDTSADGLTLFAGYVLVSGGGLLQIGTSASPMLLRATVHIRANGATHETLGERFLGSHPSSGDLTPRLEIYGRPLTRTWSLLARDAQAGATSVELQHEPAAMGWRVGDRIGMASTLFRSGQRSTTHELELDPPLSFVTAGGPRQVAGQLVVGISAEVVNLERSVLVTGDDSDFDATHVGLHTIVSHSTAVIEYARVEKCGQRGRGGRYCMHLHQCGQCPTCAFRGNAIENSHQGGITVHGTHSSTVEENILWCARDGNEMNNTFARNVIVCTTAEECAVSTSFSEAVFASGIYMLGMSNDLIENRVAHWQNTIFTPGSFDPQGKGMAWGKVCTLHSPFGKIKGQVTHGGARFGLYLDNQYPRNVERDENGFVSDWASCDEFKADGTDNGKLAIVEDSLEYHSIFVGHYTLGDVQFKNFVSVWNSHAMYWKVGKNFAGTDRPHVVDSLFVSDNSAPFAPPGSTLRFLGPAVILNLHGIRVPGMDPWF
ncbi:hypothetical protein T492DRAFT_910036 [Pavlovales sp. CCMP2436]|nr:hypothetical protein T492DRAFT_910036 [Pavlovales sp. CCMP2436]